jgi:hypothetical protein
LTPISEGAAICALGVRGSDGDGSWCEGGAGAWPRAGGGARGQQLPCCLAASHLLFCTAVRCKVTRSERLHVTLDRAMPVSHASQRLWALAQTTAAQAARNHAFPCTSHCTRVSHRAPGAGAPLQLSELGACNAPRGTMALFELPRRYIARPPSLAGPPVPRPNDACLL